MKRTFATLGVIGLSALAVAAPAMADGGSHTDDKIIVCHAGSGSNSGHFTMNSVAVPSLNGHDQHGADIIPPNHGMKNGQNWDDVGQAIHANGCVTPVPEEEKPPVEVPPVVVPPVVEQPVTETPVETPVVETPVVETPVVETPVVATPIGQPVVVPPVTVPPAAAPVVVPRQPAAAGAVATRDLGTNQGYNAQTAVGGSSSPSWLAGLGALAAAGAAVAFRRSRRTQPLAD